MKCFSEYTKTSIKKVKAKIYVIGDSHTNFFGGAEYINFLPMEKHINTSCNLVDFFKTFHLGPVLAYNAKTNSSTNTLDKTLFLIEEKYLPHNATLMLCFGEIDIRVHSLKQAEKQNKKVEEVIEDILNNYLEYIKILQNKGYTIICWGAIASQKDEWTTNPDYPKYGSEIERNQATAQFNKKLKEMCLENNFQFLSIFDDLVTEEGKTIEEFIAKDKCHLSQKAIPLVVKAL
ncbi:MAG: SGNH/GDSL hydrolase family protein, partial [bacterium]